MSVAGILVGAAVLGAPDDMPYSDNAFAGNSQDRIRSTKPVLHLQGRSFAKATRSEADSRSFRACMEVSLLFSESFKP